MQAKVTGAVSPATDATDRVTEPADEVELVMVELPEVSWIPGLETISD